MTDQAAEAERIRVSAPCSVELPAGCGKTETIARLALAASGKGERTLVLTHTHAGVDAIRKRLRSLGVPTASTRIRTLDSWCFALVSSFPILAQYSVGEEPDWADSKAYHEGGATAARSNAVRRMLEASYEMIIVDEYQDCQRWQHGLVCAVAESVPTVVFGDRMQGLFFFGADNDPVIWESDVLSVFPAVEVEVQPWRWRNNEDLGIWLLDARERLMAGKPINLTSAPIDVYPADDKLRACSAQPAHPMRVVGIAAHPQGCAYLAGRVHGYSMLEEIEGKFLLEFAEVIDRGDPNEVASSTVQFAVSCANGVANPFDTAARKRLAQGSQLTAEKFNRVSQQVAAVERLLSEPSKVNVRSALLSLSKLTKFRIYRREAWFGVLDALRMAGDDPNLTLRSAVVDHREHIRIVGRFPQSRVLARPLLIKGLEFDYAVVTDPEAYNAHELYVCLTRGSQGVALVTDEASFSPARPC